MKNYFTIFLFLIIAIPSFGQNAEKDKNSNQIVKLLPFKDIKPLFDNYQELCWEQIKYQICSQICGTGRCMHDPTQIYIPICGYFPARVYKYQESKKRRKLTGREASQYSSCVSAYSVSIPRNGNNEIKKRYIALNQRHSSRYPNSNSSKTPELQSTLQEISF